MTLSLSQNSLKNKNHHIWLNGKTWWISLTMYSKDGAMTRIRRSLATTNVEAARNLRDNIINQLISTPGQ